MFFPWAESVQLTYFNDKACGMKQAYALLKRGDKDGALQQSLSGIEEGKSNPKIKQKELGRAYYNAGMSYFTVNDFDRALEMLNLAAQVHPSKIVDDAIASCNHAKKLAADMQRFEQSVQFAAEKATSTAAKDERAIGQTSSEERLKKLNSLFKKGLISKVEYEQKKAEILKEF
jgi:tetratricopeptide (TPR) repeat protein